MGLIINWIAIIVSPIFGYSTFQVFKEVPRTQNLILGTSVFVILIFFLGQFTQIVFTLKIINELMVSVFYLSVCTTFWHALRIKRVLIRRLIITIG
jgi:hypothetical protein